MGKIGILCIRYILLACKVMEKNLSIYQVNACAQYKFELWKNVCLLYYRCELIQQSTFEFFEKKGSKYFHNFV